MLCWTPILEYIKIRPSPISKLSPDAKVHLDLHRGEKRFSCSVCSRGWNNSIALRNHERLHTGEIEDLT